MVDQLHARVLLVPDRVLDQVRDCPLLAHFQRLLLKVFLDLRTSHLKIVLALQVQVGELLFAEPLRLGGLEALR